MTKQNKIAIVFDSGTSLPQNYRIHKYDAKVNNPVEIPLYITVNKKDGSSKTWVDHPLSSIEKEEFIRNLNDRKTSVVTSLVKPEDYERLFKDIIRQGVTEIAVIPMSSKLSESRAAAVLAASKLEDHANIVVASNIDIADCRTISAGQGLLVLQADEENKAGMFRNADDLINRVESLSKNLHIAQAFSNLDYLEKGGRIGRVTKVVSKAINVVPIIGTNSNGELVSFDNPRGWKNARNSLIQHISKLIGSDEIRLEVVYFESNQFDKFLREVRNFGFKIATDSNGNEYEIVQSEQCNVVSVHSGPGVIGIAALDLGHIKLFR